MRISSHSSRKDRRRTLNLYSTRNISFRCGLVALSMCLEHFGVVVSVEEILEKAKKMGYTKQGEMYSGLASFLFSISQ